MKINVGHPYAANVDHILLNGEKTQNMWLEVDEEAGRGVRFIGQEGETEEVFGVFHIIWPQGFSPQQ